MIKKLIEKIERRKFYFAIKGYRKLLVNKNLSDKLKLSLFDIEILVNLIATLFFQYQI